MFWGRVRGRVEEEVDDDDDDEEEVEDMRV